MSRPERKTLAKEAYCPICEKSFAAIHSICTACRGPLVVLEQADDSLVGSELAGRYLLKKKLGAGGMGSVYLGEQLAVERDVVIKVIRSDLSKDIHAAKRFLREAKMASRLTHPHIVSVFEFGQTKDGLLFLAMEYLRGRTLYDLVVAEGRLDHTRATEIALQVLDGLAAAHAGDIVHRDLKPENIMILDEPLGQDFVKILDFGLAKSLAGPNATTEAGLVMGTPAYMSPEMATGDEVDERSDLYAAGVILYEMLTGALPFERSDVRALLVAHAFTEAPALASDVPAPLAHVVATLLKKDRDERYASAVEAREALVSALAVSDETRVRAARLEPADAFDPESTFDAVETAEVRPRAALAAPTALIGRGDRFRELGAAPSGRARFTLYALGLAAALGVVLAIAFAGSGTPSAKEATPVSKTPPARPVVAPLEVDAEAIATSVELDAGVADAGAPLEPRVEEVTKAAAKRRTRTRVPPKSAPVKTEPRPDPKSEPDEEIKLPF